jgi:hypothetical protein
MASSTAFCCNITFIWVSLVSFAAIINCVTFYYICIIFCFNSGEGASWTAKNSLCWRYQQLCQWQSLMSPHPKKVALVNLNQDVIFCNIEVIVHKEFISLCETVSLHCYWQVLQLLRKQVCWKCQEWWWSQNWLLTMCHHALFCQCSDFCPLKHGCNTSLFVFPWFGSLWSFFFLIIRLQLWEHFFRDVLDIQGE